MAKTVSSKQIKAPLGRPALCVNQIEINTANRPSAPAVAKLLINHRLRQARRSSKSHQRNVIKPRVSNL